MVKLIKMVANILCHTKGWHYKIKLCHYAMNWYFTTKMPLYNTARVAIHRISMRKHLQRLERQDATIQEFRDMAIGQRVFLPKLGVYGLVFKAHIEYTLNGDRFRVLNINIKNGDREYSIEATNKQVIFV